MLTLMVQLRLMVQCECQTAQKPGKNAARSFQGAATLLTVALGMLPRVLSVDRIDGVQHGLQAAERCLHASSWLYYLYYVFQYLRA